MDELIDRRSSLPWLTAALLVSVPLASLVVLIAAGSLDQSLPGFPDAGPVTRFGLPVSQALRDAASALTLGFLVLAVFCVPGATGEDPRPLSAPAGRLVRAAGLAAAAWTGASLVLLALSYSDAAGIPPGQSGSLPQVVYFASDFELGQLLAASALLALWAGILCLATLTRRGALTALVVALAAMWPLASTGHAVGASFHGLAVDAQLAHMVSAGVWIGGLIGLVAISRTNGLNLHAVTTRYSHVAFSCFVVLGLSGIGSSVTRLTAWSMVLTPYGAIWGLKIAAFTALGAFGWWHRRQGLVRLARGDTHAFRRVARLEVVVMAATLGLAVALARTGVPEPLDGPRIISTARSLLGYEVPPTLQATDLVTRWLVDSAWGPLALFAAAGYVWGVVRLRRAGHSWPLGRTLSWVFGCLLLAYAVMGAPGAYGRVMFSMHMVQHMTIATAVPTFLVLGAPVTLALRTWPRRDDGSTGPREVLLMIVHSRWLAVIGHPAVAAAIFITSLYTFYYSGFLEVSLRSHTVHNLMILHFLAAGYLFASSIVGIDPGPHRLQFPFRAVLLMVTFGAHAFFSVSLMATSSVLARNWYADVTPLRLEDLADDQYLGASLGWALGDYPLALLGGVLIIQWVRADQREQRRFDRQADRDGDAQLNAYNDYLSRGQPPEPPPGHPRQVQRQATQPHHGE